MPGTTTTATSGGRDRSVERDAVQVAPPAAVPDEAAVLVLGAGPAVPQVGGAELDGAVGRQQGAPDGGEDVEAGPADVLVELQPSRPGARVPGGQQVPGVAEDEGAVARTHELLRGGCRN